MPPFTWIVSPVTKLAAGEQRKAMTDAISDGLPSRFSGVCVMVSSMRVLKLAGHRGFDDAGETPLTRVFGASSRESARVMETMAPLVAP